MAFATPADATAPRGLAARWRRAGASQSVVLGLAIALLFVIVAYPMLWLVLAAFGIPGPPTVEHLRDKLRRLHAQRLGGGEALH